VENAECQSEGQEERDNLVKLVIDRRPGDMGYECVNQKTTK